MSRPLLPAPPQRQRFRRRLLTWYRANGRDLPWRHTDDPYHILVSEVMLQQTQVDRVLPKYHEWLREVSVARGAGRRADSRRDADVAAARLQHPAPPAARHRPRIGDEVRRRAAVRSRDADVVQGHRRLHRRARSAASRSGSARRSSTPTSRACCSASSSARATSRRTRCAAGCGRFQKSLVPHKHVFDFNQALMDFGATICVARKPKCDACPMTKLCTSFPVLSSAPRD